MPEIGEVRIIADNVSYMLKGRYLNRIEILTEGYKQTKGLSALNATLPKLVTDVKTRGKFTWIELEDGNAIGYGLGMSGNVRIEPTPEYLAEYNRKKGTSETAAQYLKHAHLRIRYANDTDGSGKGHFYYHDVRRFGRWEYLTKGELAKKLADLGSDLLQETLTDSQVITAFRRKNSSNICKVLMDQQVLAGIGNYIKAEILYASCIYPLAIVRDIPDDVLIKLYNEAKKIAKNAYMAGGASLYTFTGMGGDKSDFKEELVIYNMSKDPLGNPVLRMSEDESPDKRTTHWVREVQTIGVPASSGPGPSSSIGNTGKPVLIKINKPMTRPTIHIGKR